jgi:hypothetical protein
MRNRTLNFNLMALTAHILKALKMLHSGFKALLVHLEGLMGCCSSQRWPSITNTSINLSNTTRVTLKIRE